MNKNFNIPRKLETGDIYDITLLSSKAKSKKVYIFEISNLSDLVSEEESEKLRDSFLENEIIVQQITNISKFPEFTKDTDFVNKVMQFRYVPQEIFDIRKEIVIFDDIVAIYDDKEILVIKDEVYVEQQKQLFQSIWKEGEPPKLDFPYVQNHSFYKSIDLIYQDLQVIVWPDADAGESFTGFSYDDIRSYIARIVETNKDYYENSSYIIAFILDSHLILTRTGNDLLLTCRWKGGIT